jgi:hypothetical protein
MNSNSKSHTRLPVRYWFSDEDQPHVSEVMIFQKFDDIIFGIGIKNEIFFYFLSLQKAPSGDLFTFNKPLTSLCWIQKLWRKVFFVYVSPFTLPLKR